MTKEEAIEKIENLVLTGINTGDYEYINEAERMAYDNDVWMYFDDDRISVEDDLFYLNGAFD